MQDMRITLPNGWEYKVVYKAGYSTVGAVKYHDVKGIWPPTNADIWLLLGTIKGTHLGKEKGTKTFLVWRDPYKRVLSLYKDLHQYRESRHNELGPMFRGTSDYTFTNRFLDYFVRCDGYHRDSHTLRITDMDGLDDVDVIVKLEDLDDFIVQELGVDPKEIQHYNTSNPVDESIFWQFKNRIQEYYKPDYEYLEANQHKVWVNNKGGV